MGGPPPPPPGTDKEAERPGKIATSLAHAGKRKRRKYKRLPNKRASRTMKRY